jgi:hypothetical protein
MRRPSEMATEPTFRRDNPELCPGLIPSRLILAIKVVQEEIPTIDTCVSFTASYAAWPATSHAWTAGSRPKTRTSDLSSWLTRMQSPR